VSDADAKTVRLVTGNSSWWKARKYRREAAQTLWALRAAGWRFVQKAAIHANGADTRQFTEYTFLRRGAGASD